MNYTNAYGKKYSVGDWIESGGIKYQIREFKAGGMVVVRYLNDQDAWVYRVMSPDSIGLYRRD